MDITADLIYTYQGHMDDLSKCDYKFAKLTYLYKVTRHTFHPHSIATPID